VRVVYPKILSAIGLEIVDQRLGFDWRLVIEKD